MPARIDVSPAGHLLIDQELSITITGLAGGQAVTLLTSVNYEKKAFQSCCCFHADQDGHFDLVQTPCTSGSYTGVSPMGIFWSMEPMPDQPRGTRMLMKNPATPLTYRIRVFGGHLTSKEISQSDPTVLAEETLDRWYIGENVMRHKVHAGRVRGALYFPEGEGPFQGIIDMYGAVGGLVEMKASLLASHGFAVLALPYFHYEDLPRNTADLDLEYFLEAVDWLIAQPQVCSDGVGVMGVSRGGEIALLMGAHSTQVKCIVNICGPPFLRHYAIMYQGQPIQQAELVMSRLVLENGAITTTSESCDYTKQHILPEESPIIIDCSPEMEVWRNDAKLLNILAGDDKNGTSPLSMEVLRSCYPADKLANLCTIVYPGAGHILEPPYTHLCPMSYDKHSDLYMNWGGEPKCHAKAQEDSWRRIQEFFHEHIPCSSGATKESLPGSLTSSKL